MKEFHLGLLWIPFDHGVKLINGRVGARFGPKKIKQAFFSLIKDRTNIKNKKQSLLKGINVIDYGKVIPVKQDVKKTHEKVTHAVRKIIKAKAIPIVIGGGHDISFASARAVFQVYRRIGHINIDAHYDVRPVVGGKITSGTPFRRLLEGKFVNGKNFVELGAHSPKNLQEHYEYLIKQKATVIRLAYVNKTGIEKSLNKALLIASKNTNAVVFDIDIDSVQKRFAPGCSAPCTNGFTKSQILKAAYIAGKNKTVKLLNIMEVNPLHDINNKTVKLAAKLIVSFAKGLNERKNNDC